MIQFECYPLSERNIYLKIVTDHTERGTLYRLATAIFVMGMDIHSGDIKTKQDEEGKEYSEDVFILRNPKELKAFGDFAAQLGVLMESLLNRDSDPEQLLAMNPERKLPDIKEIFSSNFDFIIEEIPKKNQILFYFEAKDRPGLLLSITKFLYENKINIIEATIRTEYDDIAKDSFILEYDNKESLKKLKSEIQQFLNV
ncbi:MAG: ACT domain-containing protein [Leptospiraceae bacterium]|nr:ACT domain-containing protein [Leptospiraceae bacterium]MDW7976740.1 ACT domain-containing protein [Leptospiraceae bacterium]